MIYGGTAYLSSSVSPVLSASLTINNHTRSLVNPAFFGEILEGASELLYDSRASNGSEYIISIVYNSGALPTGLANSFFARHGIHPRSYQRRSIRILRGCPWKFRHAAH
jgi:hypothetical protein